MMVKMYSLPQRPYTSRADFIPLFVFVFANAVKQSRILCVALGVASLRSQRWGLFMKQQCHVNGVKDIFFTAKVTTNVNFTALFQ